MTGIVWRAAAFDELSPHDVHDVLRLRQDVFVIEQSCVFHEIDGRDPLAVHLLGHRGDRLVAYARIFAPGVDARDASIGRVVTDADGMLVWARLGGATIRYGSSPSFRMKITWGPARPPGRKRPEEKI